MGKPPQIDAVRLALRAARWLDDTRRAAVGQWERWTKPTRPSAEPLEDRRQPPDLW